MRTTWFLGACLTAFFAVGRASAAPLFGVTDLGGTDVTFHSNAKGHIDSLTTQDGSATYAFDKIPPTPIDVFYKYDIHSAWTHLTLENGGYRIGTHYKHGGSIQPGHEYTPTFAPVLTQWIYGSDVNIHGQAVGGGLADTAPKPTYFAAYTDVGLKLHGFFAASSDNLNNVIDPIPGGVFLQGASKIDDLGRILAGGSDGHLYLLTPTALGTAQPVPEPAALSLFGVVLVYVAWRYHQISEKAGVSPAPTPDL